MAAERYLKIIWMYAIGLAFIFAGLYTIMFNPTYAPSSGPTGFALMVVGLFFSTIGGFYGKKKLMEVQSPDPMESRQMDQIKQNVVSQLKPPESSPDPAVTVEPPKTVQAVVIKPEPQPQPKPEAKAGIPSAPAQSVEEKVLKIMVCPQCNSENPPSNMFCFSCGKRLRAPEQVKKPSRPKSHKKNAKKSR